MYAIDGMIVMSMNYINIPILNIIIAAYHCIIGGISKREVINLMQNTDLTEKVEHYKT